MVDEAGLKVRIIPILDRFDSKLGKEIEQKVNLDNLITTTPGRNMQGATIRRGRGAVSKEGMGGMALGAFEGVAGAEAIGTMALGIGAVVGGVLAVKTVLDMINENIKDMKDSMAEANPLLENQFKVMDKMLNLTLLPITNIMTALMKPVLSMQATFLKKQLTESKELIGRAVGGDEEAMAEVIDLFQDTFQDMRFLKRSFEIENKELIASIAGFTKGMDIDLEELLKGADKWVEGLFAGALRVGQTSERFNDTIAEHLKGVGETTATFNANWDEDVKLIVESTGDAKLAWTDETKGFEAALDGITGVIFATNPTLKIALDKALEEGILKPLRDAMIGKDIPDPIDMVRNWFDDISAQIAEWFG